MKTHIFLTWVMALFFTACASHEGRTISSTEKEYQDDQAQQAFFLERNNIRETGAANQ
jgi:heme/copper-type cytochrome/quinol oxidase subunit 3